jgi:hypothetical protein
MKLHLLLIALTLSSVSIADAAVFEHQVLATSRTATMEKEMNEAAAAGYVFADVMGGKTLGGKEVVVVMVRDTSESAPRKVSYKLLATSKTSTMQKEMQQLGDEGFEYKGQTVFETAFGGNEVVVIMERDATEGAKKIEYKLLATSRTSTMQKELKEAGNAGYHLLGLTVAKTALAGNELVCILRKD